MFYQVSVLLLFLFVLHSITATLCMSFTLSTGNTNFKKPVSKFFRVQFSFSNEQCFQLTNKCITMEILCIVRKKYIYIFTAWACFNLFCLFSLCKVVTYIVEADRERRGSSRVRFQNDINTYTGNLTMTSSKTACETLKLFVVVSAQRNYCRCCIDCVCVICKWSSCWVTGENK